jgi:hypothetical protein
MVINFNELIFDFFIIIDNFKDKNIYELDQGKMFTLLEIKHQPYSTTFWHSPLNHDFIYLLKKINYRSLNLTGHLLNLRDC